MYKVIKIHKKLIVVYSHSGPAHLDMNRNATNVRSLLMHQHQQHQQHQQPISHPQQQHMLTSPGSSQVQDFTQTHRFAETTGNYPLQQQMVQYQAPRNPRIMGQSNFPRQGYQYQQFQTPAVQNNLWNPRVPAG